MLHRHGFSNGSKSFLLAAYIDIAIEHHHAIHLLISNRIYGSAFTIVRPLFETLFRALWITKCASDNEIEQILNDDSFSFPRMPKLIKEVDDAYSSENFFKNIKKDSWSAMCSIIQVV